MSNFKGAYLRVLTPRTTDGSTIKYDEFGRIEYKESHFELSARASLEKENMIRPAHLRHLIEVAGVISPVDQPYVKRPQRVKREKPQPAGATVQPLAATTFTTVQVQPNTAMITEATIPEPVEVKQRRHRRTQAEIKAQRNEKN